MPPSVGPASSGLTITINYSLLSPALRRYLFLKLQKPLVGPGADRCRRVTCFQPRRLQTLLLLLQEGGVWIKSQSEPDQALLQVFCEANSC